MTNEKGPRKSSKPPLASGQGDSPTPPTAGALASKIHHVSVADLRKGDKVLYPGNKVIPVESVEFYTLHMAPRDPVPGLYVVKFEGQPADCYLAFEQDSKVYIYKG